jgi:hypothetical protein
MGIYRLLKFSKGDIKTNLSGRGFRRTPAKIAVFAPRSAPMKLILLAFTRGKFALMWFMASTVS